MSKSLPAAFATALILATSACGRPLPLRTDDQIIDYTDRVVRLNKLGTNPRCLQYSADTSVRGVIYVRAFELHDGKCGGDPRTRPLLFTIRYTLRDNAVATDKGSISNSFRRIRAPLG